MSQPIPLVRKPNRIDTANTATLLVHTRQPENDEAGDEVGANEPRFASGLIQAESARSPHLQGVSQSSQIHNRTFQEEVARKSNLVQSKSTF